MSKFTDRESGIFGGLMLSLREYRDRMEVHRGYKLNKKPREMDCLIIDTLDQAEPMDNDIARFFKKHNIIEFKGYEETLNIDTIWKVISYAAQYKSDTSVDIKDITITLLRASKPVEALSDLLRSGYRITNSYPGIYYIDGMVDIRMQIVVSRELKGDDFVPLRIQRKNADDNDYDEFADLIENRYSDEDNDYLEQVIKYGIYDEVNRILTKVREDTDMYEKLMEIFREDMKDDLDKKYNEGKADGKAELDKLKAENKRLKKELKEMKMKMAAQS